ncbi:hypothetical protein ACWEDZ_04225 [Streptomyces sp. NPDC005047]
MADVAEMPAQVAGPIKAVVAGLLSTHPHEIELVLRLGWQATPDGILIPVPLVQVRHG